MSLSSWHALRSIARFSNREASRADHESPDLRTRFLVLSRRAAWRHVQACIEGMAENGGGWQLEEEAPASGQFQLSRRTGGRWFASDVTVNLWRADDRRVAVDVVSASRVGRVDFGQNARNIRDFYRALEGYLQKLPADGSEGIRKNSELGIRNAELRKADQHGLHGLHGADSD
ncbi:MAG: DUF1499 domain-containing protein [Phycisphaerae bacterium]|nr:DUF1499 domain-containing protein [Phycisphaerae bacterium]